MASIDPYIEAPTVRSNPDTITSGSNTKDIDPYRQGVSITTERHRYIGSMPTLGSGRSDHVVEVSTYGQNSEYKDDPIWESIENFDPVFFIKHPNEPIYPNVRYHSTLIELERLGGFIEPLQIGARLLLSNDIEEVRTIRGLLIAGNEDTFGKTDFITQFVCEFGQPVDAQNAFEDANDTFGTLGGEVIIPGYFPFDEKAIEPFNESRTLGKTYVSGSANLSPDMQAALLAMTGSDTDHYIPLYCNSAGTGFTYDNTSNGVDSIAFGGLKR